MNCHRHLGSDIARPKPVFCHLRSVRCLDFCRLVENIFVCLLDHVGHRVSLEHGQARKTSPNHFFDRRGAQCGCRKLVLAVASRAS